MPVITIDKLHPSKPSAKAPFKMMPPKVQVGDTYYVPAKGLFETLVEGGTYDAETRSEQNGQYTNYYLDKATPVQSQQPTQNAPTGHTTPNTAYSDRDRSIVVQVCLKCATELVGTDEAAQCPAEFKAWARVVLETYDELMGVTTDKADPFYAEE